MLPEERNAHLPFLKILDQAANNTVRIKPIARILADDYYSEITEIDRRTLTKELAPWWLNRVRFVRKQLLESGYVTVSRQRVTLTDAGRQHLVAEWGSWEPQYSDKLLPRGVTIRQVMEEDPILSDETITDAGILSELSKLKKLMADGLLDPDSKKTATRILDELMEDVEDRTDD